MKREVLIDDGANQAEFDSAIYSPDSNWAITCVPGNCSNTILTNTVIGIAITNPGTPK